jgi:ABC-2 type transport system ATP-binding protein
MIIETHDLRKSFKARPGRGRPAGTGHSMSGARPAIIEAVKGIDLRVQEGEIFGFLGPNGAGKTTTLRMLATLLPPSGGQATVAGYDLLREPDHVRERIGYVGQAGGTDSKTTAHENLVLQARLYGLDRVRAHIRAAELIAALDLEPFADRLACTYSGGQRRRLDLALGLVHQPALLFLDEPTAGLDPQSRARLWEEVRRLRAVGTTVFVTTHYLDEADALCDCLAIIDGGRIVAEGTPGELKHQIAGDMVTIGLNKTNNVLQQTDDLLRSQPFVRELREVKGHLQVCVNRGEANLPDILRLLDGAGLEISTISLSRPTLDDVFLRQTGRSLREPANGSML